MSAAFSHDLRIGQLIGCGFFGEVHEGVDPVHKKVAVKVLRPFHGESSDEWNARKDALIAEAAHLKMAEHDNVVRVHALVRATGSDDRLHMVVEYCEQGSLLKEHEQGPMPLSRVKLVLNDVCRGLQCIHDRNMVHRDIKPANILGSKKRFKIGDFGLVSHSLLTGYASGDGYEGYLPPEFYKNNLTSAQSDVWAIGMTAYRLMHGVAFLNQHFAHASIAECIPKGKFASKLPWLPHIPEAWRKFIRKAMHDSTTQRYKTAREMSQGAGILPVLPEWNCQFTPSQTTWTRAKGERHIEVVHQVSSKGHSWTATSMGELRNYRLDGTASPVSEGVAVQGLEAFFASAS